MRIEMTKLQKLALERIRELGQEAFSTHEQIVIWRKEPLDTEQKTTLSVQLKGALEKQRQWIDAITEEIPDDRQQ